jgi:Domain of unknown function (DUF4340)
VKPLIIHGGLLVVSAGLAYSVWNKEQVEPEKAPTSVEVWPGSPAAFSKLSFEGKTRKVRLEAAKDATGRYYVTTVEKDDSAPDPHAGVQGAPVKAPEPKKEPSRFVSVKAGETLVKSLAPLSALRAVGKVEPARNEEFGLDKPEGTLKLTISGKEHVLTIGGTTPGGSERYAKYQATGEVFAISGDIAQTLMFGDSRLPEREMHGFKSEAFSRVRVQKANKSRELVRVKDKNEGWADVAAPTKLDETAGNWMSKLGRLRGNEFVEKPAKDLSPADAVFKIEYFDGSKPLGYVELYKLAGEKSSDYLAKSEWSRWYVKVTPSVGEQLEQDLTSVLK